MLVAKSTNVLQCHPLSAPLGQVLALRNQTLLDQEGQQSEVVPTDLVTEVRAGDADGT
jgi:hypothetical protein